MNMVSFMKHNFYLPIGIFLILLIVLSGVVISKHYVNPFYHEEDYKGQKCLYKGSFMADQYVDGIYCRNKNGELYEVYGTDKKPK